MARSTPAARKRQAIPPVPTGTVDGDAFDIGEKPPETTGHNVNGIVGDHLLAFIKRIERLKSDIRDMQDDVKEIKSEAKAVGFDLKVLNHLIKIRSQDKDDLDEFETLVDTYRRAIGM
jgi:uncharacterized protein (UPF0335 family)